MREILFRGKCDAVIDPRAGKWVFGDYRYDPDLEYISISGFDYELTDEGEIRNPFSVPVDPETVGQYTGLTDKNGKNIFEGDIVKATFDDDEFAAGGEGIGAVYFAYGQWYVCGDLQRSLHDLNCEYYIEIIGNVHDNHELMEA